MSLLENDPVFSQPYPLSDEVVYELMHLELWGENLMRARITNEPPVRLPFVMPITNARTGKTEWVSTAREYKPQFLETLKRMREE